MDEFDKPIQGKPPSGVGEPGRRGAPLGILHEWKVRVEQIDKILSHSKFNPASLVGRRLIEEKQKLEEEITNVEEIRKARKLKTSVSATGANAAVAGQPIPVNATPAVFDKIKRGEFCQRVIEQIKRIKNLNRGTGMSVAEVQNENPEWAVWKVRELLPPEDRDTFNHPNQWGPVVGYAKNILAKTSDVSVHTITSRVKAYRKSQKR